MTRRKKERYKNSRFSGVVSSSLNDMMSIHGNILICRELCTGMPTLCGSTLPYQSLIMFSNKNRKDARVTILVKPLRGTLCASSLLWIHLLSEEKSLR